VHTTQKIFPKSRVLDLNAERLSWIARGKFAEGRRRGTVALIVLAHRWGARLYGAAYQGRRPPRADLPLATLFQPFGLAEHGVGGDPGVGSSVVVAMITTGRGRNAPMQFPVTLAALILGHCLGARRGVPA